MCQYCEQSKMNLEHANAHIASLLDAIQTGSKSMWETSEPIIIGGVAGKYNIVAPYLYDCQWKVDIATAGASSSQILISSSAKETTSMPDFTGASGVSYNGLSGLDGFLINVPSNSTIPIYSEWYSIRNSDNKLYVIIVNSANAAFVNFVFRQKRNTK